MKILVDDNNILTIENENIPKTKEYTYNLSGYKFSGFDKGIIVYHKKQFKIINLKDLGDKMGVILVGQHDDEYDDMELDIQSMESALKLFDGFDENLGEKYFFLYKYGKNKMEDLNEKLKKLGSNLQFNMSERGITIPFDDDELVYNPISFLFGLVLVYGTFQIIDGDLRAVKAQIPLFGQFVDKQDIIHESIEVLAENGIYMNEKIQNISDGIMIEISSSDYELLEKFAKFYQPIENGLKISKINELENIKNDLIGFVSTNSDIPSEGKSDVLEMLENGMIKIMLK